MPPEVECPCIQCQSPFRTRRRGATLPWWVSLLPYITKIAQLSVLMPIVSAGCRYQIVYCQPDFYRPGRVSAGCRYPHSNSLAVDIQCDNWRPYSATLHFHPTSTICLISWVSAGCRYHIFRVLLRTLSFQHPC